MIKLSFLNLFRRKSRTFLGVIGIVIGVMAIIAIVSVVDGVYIEISDMIANYQGVFVWEKNTLDQSLSTVDISVMDDIKGIRGIRNTVPEVWAMPKTINGESTGAFSMSSVIYAVDLAEYTKLKNNLMIGEIVKGDMLRPGDRKKIIITEAMAKRNNIFIGSTVKINGESFRVKGISDPGSSFYDIFFMSIEDGWAITDYSTNEVSDIFVELDNPDRDKEMVKVIEFKVGDEVEAMSMSEASNMMGELLGSLRLVAFLVAAISGFVAGVGIINTMLMSVMERSKEIGTLKATGWTDWNIIKMIMYESFFIGVIGGIVGVIFGFIAAEAMKPFGLNPIVTPELVLQAFSFAIAVGIIAGLYPSHRAANLDPIAAIRGA